MKKHQQGLVDKLSQLHPSSILYRDAEVRNSVLEEQTVVGDFSRVQNSQLGILSKVDRNNLIQNSKIGRFTYTGNFTVIQSSKIGSFGSISWGVTIGGGEHDVQRLTTHDFLYNNRYGFDVINKPPYDRYSKISEVGSDVWVGANATILRGVTIQHGAVIGANSVVTHDVPAYSIVAGNPAKVIKYRFDKDVIEKLLNLKWWDLNLDLIKKNLPVFSSSNINYIINQLEKL